MANFFRGLTPSNVPGGSVKWFDPGPAGDLLQNEFFGISTPLGAAKIFCWDGTAWRPVYSWSGSAWLPVKSWSGSAWI